MSHELDVEVELIVFGDDLTAIGHTDKVYAITRNVRELNWTSTPTHTVTWSDGSRDVYHTVDGFEPKTTMDLISWWLEHRDLCPCLDKLDLAIAAYRRKPRPFSTSRELMPVLFDRVIDLGLQREFAEVCRLSVMKYCGDNESYTHWRLIAIDPETVCQAALAVCRAEWLEAEGLSPESVAKLKEGAK